VILFFCVCSARAQAVDAVDGVRINSDSLRILDQSGEIRFEGRVLVEFEGARMECDSLLLKISEDDPPRILGGTARGSVVIKSGEDKATADQARIDMEKGMVELSGSPRLERGGAMISAQRILYRLDEGTADFNGQVRAEFAGPEE